MQVKALIYVWFKKKKKLCSLFTPRRLLVNIDLKKKKRASKCVFGFLTFFEVYLAYLLLYIYNFLKVQIF